jgi:hypothetical protein
MRYDDNVKEAVHWAVLLQLGLQGLHGMAIR